MSDNRESLADSAKRRAREGSFAAEVQRVYPLDATPVEDEPEVDDCGSYGFLRGRHEKAIHLEFRRKKGTWPAPGYSWLLKPVYDPDGAITLLYASGDRVDIRGRNLRPVFDRILSHQVLWIAEQGQEWQGRGTDGLTAIYTIEYHDADEEKDG